ncbi:MAG: Uma2 family endonuclease, partial [Planctomycetes bacterium]|nr:Uma2 family endonuclease [Planctomycetota bacterium]
LKDKREKKNLYERFGVREYIVVHLEEMFIERYSLKRNKFEEPTVLGTEDVLKLSSLDGIDIQLREIFESEPPKKAGEGHAKMKGKKYLTRRMKKGSPNS